MDCGMGLEITRRRFIELTAAAASFEVVQPLARAAVRQLPQTTSNAHLLPTGSPMHEPYGFLNGGEFGGPLVPESPDPLVRYRWSHPQANDDSQSYVLSPVAVSTVITGILEIHGRCKSISIMRVRCWSME